MKRMFRWIVSWFGFSRVNRNLSALEARIEKALYEKRRTDVKLESRKDILDELVDKLDKEIKFNRSALIESQNAQNRLQQALDAVNEELRIAKEITIPALVQANDTFQKTWDAESSLMVMRRTSLEAKKEVE